MQHGFNKKNTDGMISLLHKHPYCIAIAHCCRAAIEFGARTPNSWEQHSHHTLTISKNTAAPAGAYQETQGLKFVLIYLRALLLLSNARTKRSQVKFLPIYNSTIQLMASFKPVWKPSQSKALCTHFCQVPFFPAAAETFESKFEGRLTTLKPQEQHGIDGCCSQSRVL